MKVVKWIAYKDSADKKAAMDWLGGMFNDGMRWNDYYPPEEVGKHSVEEYVNALRSEIIEKKIRITGEEHQYSDKGVPVFEDDTVARLSFRAWGDLMAAIWSTEENKDYSYMDFYM
jgi:hypothetical protein